MDNLNNLKFSLAPSQFDSRDIKYSQKNIELRESIDLREWDSGIENQGALGSCVANAITSAYELTVKHLYPSQFKELSRLFVYYNSRLFNDTLKQDIGTYIRDGLKAASKYGICSEDIWPYQLDKFDDQPNPEAYIDASNRTVTKYETLYTIDDILEVLSDGRPVVVGMALYQGFENLTAENPVVSMPAYNEWPIGNHAVVLLGYNLSKQLFLAKNSFGTEWGDRGYFWVPFNYIETEAFEKWCFDISSQQSPFLKK